MHNPEPSLTSNTSDDTKHDLSWKAIKTDIKVHLLIILNHLLIFVILFDLNSFLELYLIQVL